MWITLGTIALLMGIAMLLNGRPILVNNRPVRAPGVPLIILALIMYLISAVITIPAGFQGVLLQFQAVRGTLPPGIHLIVPFINTVQLLEVRTQKHTSTCEAASKDLQTVRTTVAVNYHLQPEEVGRMYQRVGLDYSTRIIEPTVQETIKQVTAKYNAEGLITERSEVKNLVQNDIGKRLKGYGINVETISITDFNFSEEFNRAIEAKQVAQQEALKQKYLLERAETEAKTAITTAKGKAEAARLEAVALKTAGSGRVLAKQWIEKWDGKMPLVTSGNNVMIDIRKLMEEAETNQ